MSKRRHVKYPLFLSDFNETWIFLDRFSKKSQISRFTKMRPVGAELIHADGQTNMTKLIVVFLSFANGPENKHICSLLRSLNHSILYLTLLDF
jgi:hypothetical protein